MPYTHYLGIILLSLAGVGIYLFLLCVTCIFIDLKYDNEGLVILLLFAGLLLPFIIGGIALL